ncbi:F-box protein GID2-like [Rutidosis leptorrhynchoides]|uniref:F-box protein GID2-like n=1 Tax=Rutidosis leptorrhynchoides TaxID=125765 RepID=UPI003A99A9E6
MVKRSAPASFNNSIMLKKIKTHDPIDHIASVLLDENLLHEIFKHADAKTLATAACVSKIWHKTSGDERLWEMICTQPSVNLGCNINQLRLVVLALGGFKCLHSQYLLPLSKPSVFVAKLSSSSTVAAATSTSMWSCLPTQPSTVVPVKTNNSVKSSWGKDELQLSLSLLSIRYFEKLDYNGRKKMI